jgi:hypothetical protein
LIARSRRDEAAVRILAAAIQFRRKIMRKLYAMIVLAPVLLLAVSLSAAGRQKTMTWSGWISDSGCGAKGMSPSHKACALACVHQKGAKFVFVTEDKTIHPIHNQSAVKDSDVGEEVNVTGRLLQNHAIQIQSISPTS